jgi:dephospho-CoA kinase
MNIAVTGGMCDGKSTVLGFLAEAGYPTLSSDVIVSELYSDPKYVEGVKALFGERAVVNGAVDREWVRDVIVSDSALRRKLNHLLHREVMDRLLCEMSKVEGVAYAEVPLLVETACQGLFDRVWVVCSSPEERLMRLSARLNNVSKAQAMLSTQLPTEAKLPFGDRIVRTNLPLSEVKSLVVELAGEYRA